MRLPIGYVMALALAGCGLTPQAHGQTTYTWGNVAADWNTTNNWNPGGVPTNLDTARFIPSGLGFGSGVVNPTLSANSAALSLTVAPNADLGGWTFGGAFALTIGGTGSTGLTTYGPATYTFNGPTLVGSSAASPLTFNVGVGSTLVLTGNSSANTNVTSVNVRSGTLRLDNSGNNIERLSAASTVTVSGGGTFELIGNAAGTTMNVGTLSAGANTVGGVNTFRITSNGAATTLNFANSASGFSTRPGTRAVYAFEATSGNLGDANGARVTFVGTPFLGANGLLGNSAGGGTVGFAIVRDAGGTDFATWNATNGVVRATATQTGTTAADLQGYAGTDRVQFNPTADQTASATITNGSLRITPASAGLTLALGTNNLASNAVMLDGGNDFTISGTGTLGGTGTRYLHVNNANTTLSVNGLQVANGGNPTVFAGPGLVDLTGSSSQNTLTTTNRFIVAGGVVRGNNTQIGFGSTGAGIISLTGGVLEIKNGTNGTGTAADFTRPLGAAAGNVTWGAGTTNEQGSGGFSAFGAAASVNLGGAASPTAVQWNAGNFVADGYALRFGSTRSNAVLNWLNPIQLDNGTAYQLREINVTAGTGGDKTVLQGVVSGTPTAELIKTGTGTLELSAANTYGGRTYVRGGTLLVSNTSGSGTGTAAVVVNGGTFGGTGTVAGAVLVKAGGTVRGDSGTGTGTLNVSNNVVLSGAASDGGRIQAVVNRTAANTAATSRINLTGVNDIINLGDGGGKFRIDLRSGSVAPVEGETYTVTLARVTSPGNVQLNGSTVGANTTIAASNYDVTSEFGIANGYVLSVDGTGQNLVFTFTPVPEPATILGLGAAVLGAGAFVRRKLRKTATAV